MAVTAAQARKETGSADFKRGIQAAGDRQVNFSVRRPTRIEHPQCSLDGHYNLVLTHHIQAATRRRFDRARIAT